MVNAGYLHFDWLSYAIVKILIAKINLKAKVLKLKSNFKVSG